MPTTVLIVDDSSFFRHRISDILSADSRLDVIGVACNGLEAIQLAHTKKPDIITMDVEMPQLNGIEAVRIIMRECPTRVLMISSLTHEGAQVTLQALEAGAADYLTKDIRAWSDASSHTEHELVERIVALSRSRIVRNTLTHAAYVDMKTACLPGEIDRFTHHDLYCASTHVPIKQASHVHSEQSVVRRKEKETSYFPRECKVILIGASTGGPAALQKILTLLPAGYPFPIILIQHMPKTFTPVFASRLNQQCELEVKEAEDGDSLQPGRALLAPGGQQLIIERYRGDKVKIVAGDERLTYRPSVDITYASAARAFGAHALAITLTGMGADGAEGARLLKEAGSRVWAQNEESCTIYGMPQAVIKAGYADSVLHLDDIGRLLNKHNR